MEDKFRGCFSQVKQMNLKKKNLWGPPGGIHQVTQKFFEQFPPEDD